MNTSWGGVVDWYDAHLRGEGTYHETVLAPNILRLLDMSVNTTVLDVACGTGYFTRLISPHVARITGTDIGEELIAKAQEHPLHNATFLATPAETLAGVEGTFSRALCVVALQNIKNVRAVADAVYARLTPEGTWLVVLNHPAFRIPGASSWQFDEAQKTQFRRVDAYMSEREQKIDMTPGITNPKDKNYTVSFHRPLQEFVKIFTNAGFSITRLEEWVSPKSSQKGPRKDAEDRARKEFPLFLAIVLSKK